MASSIGAEHLSPRSQPWESCHYCTTQHFNKTQDFERHLRERHCSEEGGSLLCRYGYNGVCSALAPAAAGGDYEAHVRKHHIASHPPASWDVYSAAQNLPAALNDPGRAKATSFFTATWGDSFVEHAPIAPSPYLPDITHAHFELYVRKIGKKYKKHSRIAAQYNADVITLKTSRSLSMEYDLKEIPSIFFNPSLPLNNKDIFASVFPSLGSSPDSRTCCRSLQERLSHYLDIVEVQIAKQVSQKSDAFFHAMLSHDTIMERMSAAISVVKSLRGNIQRAEEGLTTSPLKLVQLAVFKNNTGSVHNKLKLMSTVHQTQPMIQLLLSTADYVTALDLIGTTQAILCTQLSGIHAFRHLSSQLTEMEHLIDKMLTTEFRRFVAEDFNRPWGDDAQSMDEDKLISVVSGLLRRRKYEFIDICKEEAIATAQATVKQVMIEEATAHDGEVWIRGEGETGGWKGGTVGLLNTTIARLTLLLQRLLALRALVLKASLAPDVALADGEEFFTLDDQRNIEEKLQGLVNFLCDYCLERCSTLINSGEKDRAADGEGARIMEMAQMVEHFTSLCDKFTGKQCLILKNALKNRFNRFVQRFHNERINKLTLLLDNERWKKADVPVEFQTLVDYVSESGRFPVRPSGEKENEQVPGDSLVIDGEAYSVVGVVLLAIRMVAEYCSLGNGGLQDGTGGTPTGKALCDLLKLFNSRTSRRVLGAGALQSAGLKTITATNLALAWRALELIQWILSPVRRHFPSLEPQWSGLERDIAAHTTEIRAKLCSIAGSLLGAQLNCWEARPPVPSQQFRAISRHLLKLHEALLAALPPPLLRSLFHSVHRNFKDKLREQLSRMNVVANGGPQHGVVTSELTFYLQTLATLQILPEEDLSLNSMNDIWSK